MNMNHLKTITILLLMFTVANLAQKYELYKEFISFCGSETNFVKCLNDIVQDLKDEVLQGQPENGIMNPLHIERGLKTSIDNSKMNISIRIKPIDIYGLENIGVKDVDISKDNIIVMVLGIKNISANGPYTLEGKFRRIKINDTGTMTGYISNVNLTLKSKYKIDHDEGYTHIRIYNTTTDVGIESGNIQFDNLFRENRMMFEISSELIRRNFLNIIRKAIEKNTPKLSELITEWGNRLLTANSRIS